MSPQPHLLLVDSRTIIQSGNSKAVTLPPSILGDMGVDVGDVVTLMYDREQKELIVGEGEESFLEA